MDNGVQDPNAMEHTSADTPMEEKLEKGKGKAAATGQDSMEDDDEDESEEDEEVHASIVQNCNIPFTNTVNRVMMELRVSSMLKLQEFT